jgi:hypothetical protein
VLPSPLLFNTETPDILRALIRAESGVEGLPFTKYLVKMATLLRDHLRTNVSNEAIQKDMVDVVLYMQSLSTVCDGPFFTQLTKCRIKILVTYCREDLVYDNVRVYLYVCVWSTIILNTLVWTAVVLVA